MTAQLDQLLEKLNDNERLTTTERAYSMNISDDGCGLMDGINGNI